MKIIRPVEVTDAGLVATNVPENDYPEWTSGSYSQGDKVMITSGGYHRTYEALTAVTDVFPPDNPDKWLDLGATNRWKMFDGRVGTSTESSAAWPVGTGNGIQVDVVPGSVINSLALFGLYGDTVTIEVIDPTDGVVYQRTITLVDNQGVTDWYAYFFTPIERQEAVLLLDLPSYGTATLRVSIDKADEPARCGLLVAGMQYDLGDTHYGSGVGILDFSRKERDEFGNPEILEREFSRRGNFDLSVLSNRTDYIYRLLAKYRTKPLVWVGAEHRPSTHVYGYFRDFDIVLSGPRLTEITIDVEGLI